MINLIFVAGSGYRRAQIKDRKLTLVTTEIPPITLDLDRLDSGEAKKAIRKLKMSKADIQQMREIAKLGTEKEMARDIINDFQRTGWRCIKNEWRSSMD